MAGATNRAMKAAGLPRKTQETVRVALGAGMTVQSAIRHAQAHGLPLGKAKGGEVTGWQKAAAGATTPAEHRAAHEAHAASRKAAMLSARQNRVAGSLDAAGKRMLTGRMVSAMMSRQLATQQAADAQKAAMGARQNRVAGALGAASKGMLASRKAAAKPAPDPHAETRARIAKLEEVQDLSRRINKVVLGEKRKGGDDWQARASARLLAEKIVTRPDLAANVVKPDFAGRHGIPDYEFTNRGATIRRLKDQIGMDRKKGKTAAERNYRIPQQDPKFWAAQMGNPAAIAELVGRGRR